MRGFLSRWRRLITLPIAALGLVIVLYWVAQSFAAARANREVHTFFADALSLDQSPLSYVTWRAQTNNDSAFFTPYDEEEVGDALSETWRVFSAALARGDTDLLEVKFMGAALDRAIYAVERGPAQGVEMATLGFEAEPRLFHLDRSILHVVGVDVPIARFRSEGDTLQNFSLSREQTSSILIKRSTGWHVFAHERESQTPIPLNAPRRDWGTFPRAGLNYYPAETPWRAFWENFDIGVIGADLDLIKDLGAESIRIFIPRDSFIDPDTAELRHAQLHTLARMADRRGLSLVPTLFDLKGGYDTVNWATDWLYLQEVLDTLAAHPNIAFIDIKNEPDLDYAQAGTAQIQAWLSTMIALAREAQPDFAYTIGWSAANYAGDLLPHVDLVTYHDYAGLSGTADRLAEVRALAGDKAVLITEIGETSWRGIPILAGSSPSAQARKLEQRLEGLATSDGVFVWTLHDFRELDEAAIGGTFVNKGRQRHFGLIDAEGEEKPSAAVVRRFFAD